MKPQVVVIPTGTANTASVLNGLRRAGAQPWLADGPMDLRRADGVVLPGVGAFGVARRRLDLGGFTGPLRAWLASDRPTLAICLGMQLLAAGSEESENDTGLGLIAGWATRFPGHVRVPQIGWNLVEAAAGCRTLRSGHAYFANSYRLTGAGDGWATAHAEHGGSFVAACERGAVLACQFHPELSGSYGRELLQRWVESLGERSC